MTERHERHEPMEELLRAALTARADSIAAHRLRPLGPPVGVRSTRDRWLTITAPVAVFVTAAAALAAVTLTGAPDPYNGSARQRGASPTAGIAAAWPTRPPVGPAAPAEATPTSPPSTRPDASTPVRRSPASSTPGRTRPNTGATAPSTPPTRRPSGTATGTGQPSGTPAPTTEPSGTAAPTSAAPSTSAQPHGSDPSAIGPNPAGTEPPSR